MRGRISPIRTPGIAVGIERNSPHTSAGASGFGSKVSSWLGDPPQIKEDTPLRFPESVRRRRIAGWLRLRQTRKGQSQRRERPDVKHFASGQTVAEMIIRVERTGHSESLWHGSHIQLQDSGRAMIITGQPYPMITQPCLKSLDGRCQQRRECPDPANCGPGNGRQIHWLR